MNGKTTDKHLVKNSKPHISKFYKILLLVNAVLLLCICIGTFFLWRYLNAYETSLPENVTAQLLESIDNSYLENEILENVIPLLTEFESGRASEILKPFFDMLHNAHYSVRPKNDESTDDKLVYILRADSWDIGTVRLIPAGNAGFGFTVWEVGSVDVDGSFVQNLKRSVSIKATQNAQVTINNVPVSQIYAEDCDEEHAVVYCVDNIFGDIDVSVIQPDGSVAELHYADEREYLFAIMKPFASSLTILAPEGVDIYINNEILSQGSITSMSVLPSILEGYANAGIREIGYLRYEAEIDGLYSEPDITAIDTLGRELSYRADGDGQITYSVVPPTEELDAFILRAEDFTRAYISYGMNIGENAQNNFARLSDFLLDGSELRRRLAASMSGYFYVKGNTVTYNSLEVGDIALYGEDYIVCKIRYDITINTLYDYSDAQGEATTNEVKGLEVLFVRAGDKWLAAKVVEA